MASQVKPHVRLAQVLDAHGLVDDAAAGILQVSRSVLTRVRLGTRPASFTMAARIEAVFGIPAADWSPVPPILYQHAKGLNEAADARVAAAKSKPRRKAA